jgi:hypothetical protein
VRHHHSSAFAGSCLRAGGMLHHFSTFSEECLPRQNDKLRAAPVSGKSKVTGSKLSLR